MVTRNTRHNAEWAARVEAEYEAAIKGDCRECYENDTPCPTLDALAAELHEARTAADDLFQI